MMQDYEDRYYNKLVQRSKQLFADDFRLARELTEWKHRVLLQWDSVDVISVNRPNIERETILLGKEYEAQVVISTGLLAPEDIGAELLLAEQNGGRPKIVMQTGLNLVSSAAGRATYATKFVPTASGIFLSAIRIYATNPNLPHRQDFCLVKWV
jgi:phosphorylase/glycogen(starch) synthase